MHTAPLCLSVDHGRLLRLISAYSQKTIRCIYMVVNLLYCDKTSENMNVKEERYRRAPGCRGFSALLTCSIVLRPVARQKHWGMLSGKKNTAPLLVTRKPREPEKKVLRT